MWKYPLHKSFTKIIPHNSLHPQPILRFSCPSVCVAARMVSIVLKLWLFQCLAVTLSISEHSTSCALLIQSYRNVTSRLINWSPESQNNCALDTQNGFVFDLAWGETSYYGKYVPKQCLWSEWQHECVMGYCGFKQRSVWLELKLELIVYHWENKAIMGYWDWWLLTNNAVCVSMTF